MHCVEVRRAGPPALHFASWRNCCWQAGITPGVFRFPDNCLLVGIIVAAWANNVLPAGWHADPSGETLRALLAEKLRSKMVAAGCKGTTYGGRG